MKEKIIRTTIDVTLFTTLAVGWLMETTGITSAKAKEDSSERRLRQGVTVFSLIGGVLYLLNQ
ncbi:MAG TPA: hypothetical protein VF209_04160 [Patescibacteria group bacterium]